MSAKTNQIKANLKLKVPAAQVSANQDKALAQIADSVRACRLCGLCRERIKAVPGSGNFQAQLFFVGEAPGVKEDQQGEPFVGASGKLLDKLLFSIDLKRSDIFITNAVKCRPPENRDPKPQEKSACRPWLEQQIAIIKPKIIITLGRHAMANFLPPQVKISAVHGQPQKIMDEKTGQSKFWLLPLYHPAVALYQPKQLEILKADFLKIPKIIKQVDKH